MHFSRRNFLKASAALAVPTHSYAYKPYLGTTVAPHSSASNHAPNNENYWASVAGLFDINKDYINLENGYYGIMPTPIYANYLGNMERLNRQNSFLLRSTYKGEVEEIRRQLAALLMVSSREIVFTRGGTEALQNLISGYNKLVSGDKVMYADLDYYSCQYAFSWLEQRRQVEVVKINIPEPAEKIGVIECYARALEQNPSVKLILLTHLSNRTGLVTPVKEIVALARSRGVDVIVDAAHSWAQLDFKLPDLNADFVGLSLHKWIHAPLGLGCMYIRENRIQDIDPCFDDQEFEANDIRSRVHSGTLNAATVLTLPAALEFHAHLGATAKQERLQYLRNSWVSQVKSLDGIEILTPEDPQMYAGITSFRLRGHTSMEDNQKIVKHLFNKHRIFSVARGEVSKGACVRITPALFTSRDDVEKFAVALTTLIEDRS